MQEKLEIGQIVNTFGLRGEVKVNPFVNDITRFNDLKKVYVKVKNEEIKYEVEYVKYQKNVVLMKLKKIDKIEDAEKYKNAYLYIDREDAVELEEGEYFIADLIGLNVITDSGENLGKIDDIYNRGSSDIYVVKDEKGKQYLIPAIKDVIKEINLKEEKIIIHLIDGLLDGEEIRD